MATPHQWKYRYRPPIASGTVISTDKPGRTIANCITEIQDVIGNIQGADEDSEASDSDELLADLAESVADLAELLPVIPSPTGVTDGKVMQAQNNTAVWDWVRATG